MAEEKAKKPDAKKDEAKVKRSSALKRDLQSEKRRLRNRSCRSSVQTAIRNLKDAVAKKEAEEVIKEKLNMIYSLVDKGVNRGVFKSQKAARTKSRLTAHVQG